MSATDEEQRKLAASMFTDRVGYSALAHRNEAREIELLEDGAPFGLVPFNPMATGRPTYAAFGLQANHPIDSILQVHNFSVTATPASSKSGGASAG